MLSVIVTETAVNEVGKHNLFNNIKNHLAENKVDFKLITFKSRENEKIYSNRNLNVNVIKAKKFNLELLNYIYLFLKLLRMKPNHLIIGGYGYMQNWIALFYAIIFNKKRTIWTGASETSSLNKNFFLNLLKSFFVKRFDNSIVYGKKAKNYLEKLGFKKKIFLTKNISDVEYFSKKKIPQFLINKKNYNKLSFIFCARLLKHKGIDYLLNSFQKINKKKYFLTIVGDGPLKKNVIKKIRQKKINAKYIEKLNQKDLSNKFYTSDIFISTTFNDPFTRTLSEAISARCYCVSSIYDDASFDLISNNCGILYDPKKNNALFNIINRLIDKPHLIKKNLINIKLKNFNTKVYSSIFSNCILSILNE